MRAEQLITDGINHLQSYFSTPDEKNAIRTKFSNISGKTGRYFVEDTLFQKRTSRSNRVLIPFQHVIDYSLTYEQLDTFEGGVAVEFVNNDFFEQLAKPINEQHEIFKQLKDKLGSDDNVSAIIVIRGVGHSDSQQQRLAFNNLQSYMDENYIDEDDALIKRRKNISYNGKGNKCWEGFLYYNIKGGQQDTRDSHLQFGISSNEVQLFNPSVEYAGENVSSDITLILLFFSFFSVPVKKREDAWYMLVNMYQTYLESRVYDTGNLFNYVSSHISINMQKDILVDPIQFKPILLEYFALKNRSNQDEKIYALDITHQVSIEKSGYKFDLKQGILLTPARPTNLFWSMHLSNMMQQNFSLKEYFDNQRRILKEWEEINIDALLERSF